MPSVKIQNDTLKKEYLIKIKKVLDKIKETKTTQLSTSNGNIRIENRR